MLVVPHGTFVIQQCIQYLKSRKVFSTEDEVTMVD